LRQIVARLTLLAVWVLLSSCSSALHWNSDYHTVQSGETVFSIAEKYDLAQRDLIRWNNLGDGSLIHQGQKLRVRSPGSGQASSSAKAAAPAPAFKTVPPPAWRWPTEGPVLYRYGQSIKTESGIRIGGKVGQWVVAVAPGEVVYAGDGLARYGQLLIIKHNDSWLSAYGFNSELMVGEGNRVRAGQPVARMGQESSGKAQLHFEIRRNGEPVNPLSYLPPR
jgi:lipoprotein NlpD